jgi:hypothetical protein
MIYTRNKTSCVGRELSIFNDPCSHIGMTSIKFMACICGFCVHVQSRVITSLCSIKIMVFIMEAERVYCAVRTESLNVFQVNVSNE